VRRVEALLVPLDLLFFLGDAEQDAAVLARDPGQEVPAREQLRERRRRQEEFELARPPEHVEARSRRASRILLVGQLRGASGRAPGARGELRASSCCSRLFQGARCSSSWCERRASVARSSLSTLPSWIFSSWARARFLGGLRLDAREFLLLLVLVRAPGLANAGNRKHEQPTQRTNRTPSASA
jgi:hypothetical protein